MIIMKKCPIPSRTERVYVDYIIWRDSCTLTVSCYCGKPIF